MDKYFVSRRAILTPKNENVDKINEMIMEKFPGIGHTYLSADTVAENDLQNAYPTEFLNSITLSGMATTFCDTEGWGPCHSLEESEGRAWKWTSKWNMPDHTKT